MDERFLHHIWDGGHLKMELVTVSGKHLRVGYSGQYNTNRGPDFLNSGLVIDGLAVRGDVEIHQLTTDWHAHNHAEDHFYNKVALHVVFRHNSSRDYTIKENGEAIEILELKEQLSEEIDKLLREHQPRLPKGRPAYCDLLSALDNDRLGLILRDIGLKRFLGKVNRFNASLMFSGFDQILYEGLFEAMGYDKNKTAMLLLAQDIPLARMLEWSAEGLSMIDLLAIYAIASGLLAKSQKLVPNQLTEILQQAWQAQNRFGERLSIDWQLFRIRPANHPIYRLLALIPMVHRYAQDGLLSSLLRELHPRGTQKQWDKGFTELFSSTLLPGAEMLPRPGQGVLSSIYVNICLPVFYLWGQKTSDNLLMAETRDAYLKHRGLAGNQLIRMMSDHTDPRQQKMINSKAVYQQALIELHQRFCRYHICDECRTQRIG